MDKSPEAFRTISEVAEALDVPPHVLRFWETRFTQVKPVKRGGGRRYYRPEDVRLLRGIRGLLYDDGMTIKGVQKILREKGVRHVDRPRHLARGGARARTAGRRRPPRRPIPAPRPAEAALVRRAPAAAAGRSLRRGGGRGPHRADRGRRGEAGRERRQVALKTLVAELEALRAVMIADPQALTRRDAARLSPLPSPDAGDKAPRVGL